MFCYPQIFNSNSKVTVLETLRFFRGPLLNLSHGQAGRNWVRLFVTIPC
jgi:hypothetical protein